jgi:type IV pilus biogenesis protein CpaD/CtpE
MRVEMTRMERMKPRTMRATLAPGTGLMVGVLLAGVAGCTAGDSGRAAAPVDLRFAIPPGGITYTAEYSQEVLVDMGDHAMEASRRYGARYTITDAGGGDERKEASVHLDSLGIAVTTGQGRQAFDTRHLIGDEFTMIVQDVGGAPEYGGELPAIDLGPMLGGAVGPMLLMDYGFPQLPGRPVSVGDTWVSTSTRSHVEGILEVTAHLTAEYTFAGWETAAGVECVRIEASVTGDLSGLGEQHEVAFDYTGTLHGTRVWLFDPASGSLVQMHGEDSTEGVMTSESVNAPVRQHTTVHIRSVTR